MQPIGKYILVKEIEEDLVSSSGILLSKQDTQDLRYKKAVVHKAGTDVKVIPDDSTIYFDKRSGYKMMIGDESFTVISESDVVVVV